MPKVSLQDVVPLRAALRELQLAEQLVKVPRHPGYALAVVAVRTLGWRAALALLEQLTPPAQGVIQILGRAEAVVDVSVIMQPQFLQSFVENVEVPQTQFFDRVVVQLCKLRRSPLLYNDRCLGLTEQKTVEVPQLQCSDKVYDVPVVQVVARVESASDSVHRQSWVLTAVTGLLAVFPHFSRSSGMSRS